MQTETEITYELWDDEPHVLPPHSRLYHLEPIGMGSPFVESLTSYVTRLAEAHSILSRTLVTDDILPRLNQSHLYHNGHPTYDHLTKFWKQSAFLNGTSMEARNWVQAMEQLTLRCDLRFLTMLTWSSVLSSRGLLRPTQAWCPACYQEWRERGRRSTNRCSGSFPPPPPVLATVYSCSYVAPTWTVDKLSLRSLHTLKLGIVRNVNVGWGISLSALETRRHF